MERRFYDIMKGETRTPEFLAKVNANGRIPVLQDGDRFLPESNAACFYLADGSPLIPTAVSTGPTCCAGCSGSSIITSPMSPSLRFWLSVDRRGESERRCSGSRLPGKREAGDAALALMDKHLADRDWFVGDAFEPRRHRPLRLHPCRRARPASISTDIQRIRAWLGRVAGLPDHVAMD